MCETCDCYFYTEIQLEQHLNEHIVCNLNGCTFTAHESIMEKHIQMQHESGLYERIYSIQTPEDIEKWILERRRNYPKKENVDKRRNEQLDRLKRGAKILKKADRFGKDKFRRE